MTRQGDTLPDDSPHPPGPSESAAGSVPGSAPHRRILVILLRLAGAITATAFLAIFLPTEWMAAVHARLGLGEFPRVPVVDYLTRSIAALYGFHGVLLLLVSRDPVRHRAIVRYVGVMHVLFGAGLVAIDLHAGLPLVWALTEGPPIVAFGLLVLYLSRGLSIVPRRAAAFCA
jgi:hypothetical protein